MTRTPDPTAALHAFVETARSRTLLLFTLRWAHNLTVAYRSDTHEQEPAVAAARGWDINELQHRVISAAAQLVQDPGREEEIAGFVRDLVRGTSEYGTPGQLWAAVQSMEFLQHNDDGHQDDP